MSKKNKTISAAVSIVLLVGIFVAVGFKRAQSNGDDGEQPLTTELVRTSMTVVVTSSGEIEALKSTRIVPQIRTSAVISYLVEEGARVTKGEKIGELNGEDLVLAIEELEQEIADRKVLLKDAEAELEIQVAVNASNLKTAEDNLKAAELTLKKFDDADTLMATRAAELSMQTAESNFSRSEKRYKDLKTLLDEGFITEDEVEEGRITLEQNRVSVETAEMDMQVLKDFTFPLERSKLQNELTKTTINLKKIQTESESTLNTRRRAVQKAERNLANSERNILERSEMLEGYTIFAPTDGVVYYGGGGSKYSSRANIEIGGSIYSGYTMFTIPDFTGMMAEIDVAESEIHKLEVGLPVALRVDAVPEKIYHGKIIKIAEVAKDGGIWRGGLKEFEVQVSIEDDEGLKPGYSCKAEVITGEINDALQLPVQAVFRDEETFFVYVADGNRFRKQPVTIGQSTTTHVQIESGVDEGVRVCLTPPTAERGAKD